jgi:hypothetical protein
MAEAVTGPEGAERSQRLPRPRGPRRHRSSDAGLKKLFGDPVPERELTMWSLMDESQRQQAMQRARALVRWNNGGGAVSARKAAEAAGVSLVRFYQMNARWREQKSLAVLGVGAAPERGRRSQFEPHVNQVLQSAVAELVKDDEASIRALALLLAEVAVARGVPEGDLPGHNTLRTIVERARRARRREKEVGNALLLDHAACGVLREDGAPWTIFVIADAASQLILGASPGEPDMAAQGYGDAARDALNRIQGATLGGVPWSDRLSRLQVVPGIGEAAAFERYAKDAASIGVGLNVTADRKAGRYLEQVVGRSIGVLPIWPERLVAASLPTWAEERAPRLNRERARARITLAVNDYNDQLLAVAEGATGRSPPAGLTQMLEMISG